MCGIHGQIFHRRQVDPVVGQRLIDKMIKSAAHRGPDQSEIKLFPQACIGMNRLSIMAPDEKITILSQGPLHSVLNGEIVNFQKLQRRLGIDSGNDSSLILPLFTKHGALFTQHLAGMFAIAIYDQQKHQLHLWRDPLGIKPLYYYHDHDQFIFSSEIKSIRSALANKPQPSFAALDQMLRFRFKPGRETVFPEIKRVLPGEYICVDQGRIHHQQYWRLRDNNDTTDSDVSVDEFRQLLSDIIWEYVNVDVPAGTFVSGGLDSSLVTSLALKKESSFNTPISLSFKPTPADDELYCRQLESYLQTKIERVTITPEIARNSLEKIVLFQDEPMENPIHIGTYLLAERAKDLGIKTVITGDGSDEFFLGYARQGCWFNNPTKNPSIEYPQWLWSLTPEEISDLYTDLASEQIKPLVNYDEQLIEPFTNIKQVLHFERFDRLTEYHNNRLDRMTMAHGVEARVPFLDHRIVEYSLRISCEQHYGQTGKQWLQQVARPFVPVEIINRPKVHFPSLPDQWISDGGISWAKEILLDSSALTTPWIKRDKLERYLIEQSEGKQHGRMLWALLTLELWLQSLNQKVVY